MKQANPIYAVRLANLRKLASQLGGPTHLAIKLGHANASYLSQLIGPNPTRHVSEKVARDIETALELEAGSLDREGGRPAPTTPPVAEASAMVDVVRTVGAELKQAGLQPDAEQFAAVVELAYDRMRVTGHLEVEHIKKLVQLMS